MTVIEVGDTPHSVAVSPDGTRAYVTHFRSGGVSVIDTAGDSVVASFGTRPGPYGAAVSGNGKFLHVAYPDSEFLDSFEIATGERASDGIGVKSYGLARASGGTLYAGCALSDSIEILGAVEITTIVEAGLLDAVVRSTGRLTGADFPVAVAVAPDGSRLYASNYFSGTVSVIDLTAVTPDVFESAAHVVAKVPVGPNPYGIAVSAGGKHVYVAHFPAPDEITVLDTDSLSVVRTVTSESGPLRGVAVTPDETKLYVTDYFAGSVSVHKL